MNLVLKKGLNKEGWLLGDRNQIRFGSETKVGVLRETRGLATTESCNYKMGRDTVARGTERERGT